MKFSILIYFILATSISIAQNNLPVIMATSGKVAIRDGSFYDNNAWSLSPRTKPDIFICDRTRKTKWVVFYTDIDSIKVKVKPGTVFNFIILLNGKDSCYTQIRSAISGENKLTSNVNKSDTIHFTLTPYNAVHVKSILNERDTLNLHFDIGSFDFRLTKDAILKKTKLLSGQPDALTGKANPEFNNLEKVFKIQIGDLIFTNPEVVPTGFTAHGMDGRFGWNIFEGRVVEIDYDKNLLIIHTKLPKKLNAYVKSKIEFTHSFVCIKGTFVINNKKYIGNFLLDSGSDQAIMLDSLWASKQNFPKDLKLLKSSKLKDPRGVLYETRIVVSPLLKINGFELTNIPTYLLGNNNPVGFEINYLGNDLLKRFNTILDFRNDYIYLKSNSLMSLPYRNAGIF
ncbi:MAG: hypothetical protein IPP72_02980 [Chitinophagaceae bacterium]|nr:hypothetical protein [Chitinophagaceae bacterium]